MSHAVVDCSSPAVPLGRSPQSSLRQSLPSLRAELVKLCPFAAATICGHAGTAGRTGARAKICAFVW